MVRAGHPQSQAVAAALNKARQGHADGNDVKPSWMNTPINFTPTERPVSRPRTPLRGGPRPVQPAPAPAPANPDAGPDAMLNKIASERTLRPRRQFPDDESYDLYIQRRVELGMSHPTNPALPGFNHPDRLLTDDEINQKAEEFAKGVEWNKSDAGRMVQRLNPFAYDPDTAKERYAERLRQGNYTANRNAIAQNTRNISPFSKSAIGEADQQMQDYKDVMELSAAAKNTLPPTPEAIAQQKKQQEEAVQWDRALKQSETRASAKEQAQMQGQMAGKQYSTVGGGNEYGTSKPTYEGSIKPDDLYDAATMALKLSRSLSGAPMDVLDTAPIKPLDSPIPESGYEYPQASPAPAFAATSKEYMPARPSILQGGVNYEGARGVTGPLTGSLVEPIVSMANRKSIEDSYANSGDLNFTSKAVYPLSKAAPVASSAPATSNAPAAQTSGGFFGSLFNPNYDKDRLANYKSDSVIQRTGEGGTESALDFIRNSDIYKKRIADTENYAEGGAIIEALRRSRKHFEDGGGSGGGEGGSGGDGTGGNSDIGGGMDGGPSGGDPSGGDPSGGDPSGGGPSGGEGFGGGNEGGGGGGNDGGGGGDGTTLAPTPEIITPAPYVYTPVGTDPTPYIESDPSNYQDFGAGQSAFGAGQFQMAQGPQSGFGGVDFSQYSSPQFAMPNFGTPQSPAAPAAPMARGGTTTTTTVEGAIMPHAGPIHSQVAGRTDHLPMHVKSGSYVIPADIISAMGEGNTMAGFRQAKRVFGSEPYEQASPEPYAQGTSPYNQASPEPYEQGPDPYGAEMPTKAVGGGITDDLVPIVAAGGEYVITPKQVSAIGKGDLDHGHKILDAFVKKTRAKTIDTLKKLPGPKKD